jgi:hypothetical protein
MDAAIYALQAQQEVWRIQAYGPLPVLLVGGLFVCLHGRYAWTEVQAAMDGSVLGRRIA